MPESTFPPKVPSREFLQTWKGFASNLLKLMEGFQHRFGEIFQLNMGKREFFVTTGPTYASHVLVKNHRNYSKDRPTRLIGETIGNGIIFSDGEYWLKQRRLIQPAFHKKQIENLANLMIIETDQLVEEIAQQKDIVNVHQLMTTLTLRVVSRTLFSIGIDEHGIERIELSMTEMLRYIVGRIRNPIQVAIWNLTGKTKYFMGLKAEMDQMLFDMVDARKEEGVGNRDLMDMLLSAKDAETELPLSREELRQELIGLYAAGHETSANGLTFTLMLLAQHPDILQKVIDEVDKVLGKEKIQFAHLRELTYLKQVIDESLRMYPPAWVIGREALQDDQIGELSLRPGHSITIFIYGLHRNPEYWPDPEKFDPERFSPENIKNRPSHVYLPFGAGPRLCVGNQFAIVEMQIALAMILQRFKITRTNPEEELDIIPSITLRPKTEILMTFEERKG
ncbi:MAG: cytochrome P450 [Bacteroidota bacterium]